MIGSCTPLLPWIGQAEQKKMDEYFTLIIANGRICYFFFIFSDIIIALQITHFIMR